MFFFFFDNLNDNTIVDSSFYNQCFKKVMEMGYCDMNPFLGRPKIRREAIAYELEMRKSPLAILFKKAYPKSIEEARNKFFPKFSRGSMALLTP